MQWQLYTKLDDLINTLNADRNDQGLFNANRQKDQKSAEPKTQLEKLDELTKG